MVRKKWSSQNGLKEWSSKNGSRRMVWKKTWKKKSAKFFSRKMVWEKYLRKMVRKKWSEQKIRNYLQIKMVRLKPNRFANCDLKSEIRSKSIFPIYSIALQNSDFRNLRSRLHHIDSSNEKKVGIHWRFSIWNSSAAGWPSRVCTCIYLKKLNRP